MTYTYNGDGLKTRRVGPDGTRRYYYDGIRPIWEGSDAGSLLQQYDRDIFGNLLSRRDSAGVRRYYHFDGLGSTTALTNESGAVAATLLYDAWGNERASTGSNWGRYRFTGAERDSTTGLYHMGARFYDPAIGRWLSEDPVQDKPFEPLSLNFYAYANGNPVLMVDPRGTTSEDSEKERQKALQDIANRLGMKVEEVIELLKELFAWMGENLNQLAAVAGIVAAGAALLAVGVVAGIIAGKAAAAIVVAGVIAAAVSALIALVQASQGKTSWGAALTNAALSILSAVPAFGAGRVAQIVSAGRMLSGFQAFQVAAWGHLRAYTMGSWILSYGERRR